MSLLSRLTVERWRRSRCRIEGAPPRMLGRIWVHGGGTLRCGPGVVLDGSRVGIELHAGPGAEIVLGPGVHVEGGCSIEAMRRVSLAGNVRLRAFTKIMDTHFHPLGGDPAVEPTPSPVEIEAAVDVGERCVILPGACLGEGARLGPGVVTGRRIPARAHLAGAPARRVDARSES